ncbi:hypothetical protein [Trichlorobacter lovleyi]|uniref:Uncharacterized protein n=1 Tax=Trichlorobacter lovleyi (strain ATCC BAA-1151 / DSM 17278 / SZ) TaxID=398767 RepID=B3E3T5_TRIL1|nr:hypothetical protein [Trichlorobacter lovleyi]ACD94349.1 conserved hypothetical protein [Trichlorobacter lovleyi SZ]
MMHRYLTGVVLAGLLAVPAGLFAAEEATPQPVAPAVKKQAREQIYGSQLMTRQERLEHRTKLRAAKTAEEREQIRKEHHEKMQQRARERGVTLPDMPARPAGMGPRPGGMGPGAGGMGPGGPGPNR